MKAIICGISSLPLDAFRLLKTADGMITKTYIFATGCADLDTNCPQWTAHCNMEHIKTYWCRKTCGDC